MSIVPDRGAIEHLAEQVKALLAPEASPAETHVFALICQHLNLDPFAGEIVLIGRYDGAAKRRVFKHQVTVAGRRTIADRTGRLEGIEGPVWCGPRDPKTMALDWREVWDDDAPPYAARCLVHVRGWKVPANGTAKFVEFAQKDRDGKLTPIWQQYPSLMLGKVAESLALRRGFSEVATALRDAGRPYDFAWPVGEETLEDDDVAAEAEVVPELAPAEQEPESELDPANSQVIEEARAELPKEPPPLRSKPDEMAGTVQVRLIKKLLDDLKLSMLDVLGSDREPSELTFLEARSVIETLKAEARSRASK